MEIIIVYDNNRLYVYFGYFLIKSRTTEQNIAIDIRKKYVLNIKNDVSIIVFIDIYFPIQVSSK